MIIAFGSTSIRNICEDPSAAEACLGIETAEALRSRLADVRAALTVDDLLVGEPTTGGEAGRELRITLGLNARLVLRANHRNLPITAVGHVDWDKVSYVQITEIEEI